MTFHMRTNNKSSKAPGNPPKDWYRLDLSAIVYPTLQRRDFSSVYRLSVLLKEDIKPDVLQKAVDIALKRFPTYKVCIHKGLFWRYLEPNNRPGPFVKPDIHNPCMPMHFKSGSRYLLRVFYYGRRISLECHHCLGDGSGGMCVLQTITGRISPPSGRPHIQRLFCAECGRRTGSGRIGRCLHALCQRPCLPSPPCGKDLSYPGHQRAVPYLQYYRRHNVRKRSCGRSRQI